MMNKERAFYKEAIKNILPDEDLVRRNAMRRDMPCRRRIKKRWLLPAVACLVAFTVICAAIPPVRAAISYWFERNFSVQNYVAEKPEARPSTRELDTIMEKTKPEKAALQNSIEIVNVVPKWQDWASGLHPKVGDVLFDGKELIVSFDMGGGAAELLLGGSKQNPVEVSMNDPGYVKLNGEKYAFSLSSQPAESEHQKYQKYLNEDGFVTDEGKRMLEEAKSVMCAATINFLRTSAISEKEFGAWGKEHQNAWLEEVKKVQKYDPEYTPFEFKTLPAKEKLKGIQVVEANIPLFATDFSKPSKTDKEGQYFQGEYIGLIKLRFGFDPEAGNDSMKSYDINRTVEFKGKGTFAWADWNSDPKYVTCVNKTLDLTGVKMTAKQMDVYATGAELYMSITCPGGWDELDKKCFLGSLTPRPNVDSVKVDISRIQFGLQEKGEDLGMCIYLNLLPSEVEAIKSFEIIPVLSRYTGYDDVPYVEGKPTRIKQEDVKGWQEDSTELENCILRFDLD